MADELSDEQILQMTVGGTASPKPPPSAQPGQLSDEDILALTAKPSRAEEILLKPTGAPSLPQRMGSSLRGMPAPGLPPVNFEKPKPAPEPISDEKIAMLSGVKVPGKPLPAPGVNEIFDLQQKLERQQLRTSDKPTDFLPPEDQAGVERIAGRNRSKGLAQLTSDYLKLAETPEGFFGGVERTITGEGGWKKALPFVGGLSSAAAKSLRNELLEKMKKGEELSEDEQTAVDAMALASRRVAQNPEGWEHFRTKVGELTGASLPYAAEFAMTGGIYTGSKAVVEGALKNAPKLVKWLAPRLAGVGAQTAVGGPTRIADNYYDRISRDWNVDPDTLHAVISDKDQDKSVLGAMAGSVGDTYIEYLSERTGRFLGEGVQGALGVAGRLADKVGLGPAKDAAKATITKLFRIGAIQDYLRKHESATILQASKALAKSAHWDGVPGEVFEEHVGSGLKALVGVDPDHPVAKLLLQGKLPEAIAAFKDSLPIGETPAMAASFGLLPLSTHAAALGSHAITTFPGKMDARAERRRMGELIGPDVSTPGGREEARQRGYGKEKVFDYDPLKAAPAKEGRIVLTDEEIYALTTQQQPGGVPSERPGTVPQQQVEAAGQATVPGADISDSVSDQGGGVPKAPTTVPTETPPGKPPEVTPPTPPPAPAAATPALPTVGDTIEITHPLFKTKTQGVVTRLTKDPVTGDMVPWMKIGTQPEFPAGEWYDSGTIVKKAEPAAAAPPAPSRPGELPLGNVQKARPSAAHRIRSTITKVQKMVERLYVRLDAEDDLDKSDAIENLINRTETRLVKLNDQLKAAEEAAVAKAGGRKGRSLKETDTSTWPKFLTDYWAQSKSAKEQTGESGTAFIQSRLDLAGFTQAEVITAIHDALKAGATEDFILDLSKSTAPAFVMNELLKAAGKPEIPRREPIVRAKPPRKGPSLKPKKPEAKPPEKKPEPQLKEIGKNADGNPLFEDENGVRSFLDPRGILINEPVFIVPTRAGVKAQPKEHTGEFLTAEEAEAKKPKTPPAPPAPAPAPKPSITDNLSKADQDRLEILKRKLREKLGKGPDVIPPPEPLHAGGGLDPELINIGAEMAGLYIKAGTNKFKAFAQQIKADLPEIWDNLKAYLKGIWESAAVENPDIDEPSRTEVAAILAELDKPTTKKESEADVNQPPKGGGGGGGVGGTQPPTTGTTGKGEETSTTPTGAGGGVQPGTGASDEGSVGGPGPGGGGIPDANAVGVSNQPTTTPTDPSGGKGSPSTTTGVRGGTTQTPPKAADIVIDTGPGGPKNLRLTQNPAPTGPVARIEANIKAIELLKDLEEEKAFPTDEERAILAAWSGWGSFKELFNEGKAERREFDPGWVKRYGRFYDKLRALLTPAEFNAAAESSVNAHYTGPDVIGSMWNLAQRLGFKGGRVLESSAGRGDFIGFSPDALADRMEWTAVELDTITGRILKYLYPQADVRVQGFETVKIPNAYYDLAIGNVPFHEIGPGKEYPDLNLHNYFIARMLDKVKPGGIVLAITSSGTMEAQYKQRQILTEKGELIGAIRLPSNAFKESAATEVVTDILVFRKPDGKPFDAQKWLNQVPLDIEGKPYRINEYFAGHPDMVLGKNSLTGTMYRAESYTVKGEGELQPKLDEAIAKFPENVTQKEAVPEDFETQATQLEDHSLVLNANGEVMEARGFEMHVPDWKKGKNATVLIKRAKQYIALRDVLVKQYSLENNPASTDEELEANRKELRAQYAKWVKANGTLNLNSRSTSYLSTDPNYYTVLALENVKEVVDPKDDTKTLTLIEPADVLSQRVNRPTVPPEKVDNAVDAMAVSLSFKGTFDMEWVKILTGLSEDQITADLIAADVAFLDPDSGTMVTKTDYLSGDVREKLAKAMFAAKDSDKFKRNVEALRSVIPDVTPFEKINTGITARWTPTSVLNKFASEVLGISGNPIVFIPGTEEFAVTDAATMSDKSRAQWSTEQMGAKAILQHALNFKRPEIVWYDEDGKRHVNEGATALARQIADRMAAEYVRFIKTSQEKVPYRFFDSDRGEYRTEALPIWDVMEREYNKRFNSFVDPTFDGSLLKLPGLSLMVRRTPHLMNGVMRAITAGSAVFAHGVGSGKTFLGLILGRELKRIGISRKFIHVVKKPTVAQYRMSIEKAYPGSKVLIPSKKDFQPENRKKLTARIASGRWDFIILTHEQFKSIRPGDQLVQQFYDEQIEQLRQILREMGAENAENAKSTRGLEPAVRNIVKKIKSLKKRLDQHMTSLSKRQDVTMPWEELGVDGIFVDESHNFKKMPIPTQIEQGVKGIPSDFSQRAVDLLIKIRNVQQRTNGRNIFFASGTPVSNTLAELWVQFHATNPRLLEQFSVKTFDSFATAFADIEESFELGWDNKFRDVTRMARFKNPTGLTMLTRFGMDVRIGNKELGLDVPEIEGGRPKITIVKPTQAFMKWVALLDRISSEWDMLDKKGRFENSWVPIATMRAGVAAALDPRAVFADAEDDPNSKVNQAVRDIFAEWQRGREKRTTMMVFADMYRRMNTDKLMGFLGEGGHGQPAVVDTVVPEGGEAEGEDALDPGKADEAAYEKNAVGDFNLYNDIRRKLVGMGVPEHEIGLITENDTDSKRDTLFNKVRNGSVRILIGSTEKIGEGVDVPQRMSAQFHLDPPMQMTPAKLEQRLGRIIRQGNLHSPKNWNELVRITYYGTERSMDAAIYQMLETKGIMVLQALKGQFLGETFEDPASELTLAMAEMKAAATGDTRALDYAKLRKEVRDLSNLENAFLQRMSELRRNIADKERESAHAIREAKQLRTLASEVAKVPMEKETMSLLYVRDQKRITGQEDVQKWLKAADEAMTKASVPTKPVKEKWKYGEFATAHAVLNIILGDNIRVQLMMAQRSYWDSGGAHIPSEDRKSISAVTYLGGAEPAYDDPRWDSTLNSLETLMATVKRVPVVATERAGHEDTRAAQAASLAAAYSQEFNTTTFEQADELVAKRAAMQALETALRAPTLTPIQKFNLQAEAISPPLFVRLTAEIAKLDPQIEKLREDEAFSLRRAKALRMEGNDVAAKRETDLANDAAGDAQALEDRQKDLVRRLSIVEKARLDAAHKGKPSAFGQTPTQRGRQASMPGETPPDISPFKEDIEASSPESLRAQINQPGAGLPAEAVKLINAFLDGPLGKHLEGVRFRVADALAYGWQGSYFQGLVELARDADPETGPHEFLHHIWTILPDDIKAEFERLRVESLNAMLKEEEGKGNPIRAQVIRDLIQNPIVSGEDYMARQYPLTVRADVYAYASPEEFFTHSAAAQFKQKVGSKVEGFWPRVKKIIKDFIAAVKHALGLNKTQEEWINRILAGKFTPTLETSLRAEQQRAALAKRPRGVSATPAFSPKEVEAANRTARAAGAVGSRAITPRYVAQTVQPGETVLNFGAGKPDATGKYGHSEMIREKGGRVAEYDFGGNQTGDLGETYDTVFASNVLNVQADREMLNKTLDQILDSVKEGGRAVFNYPESPRYSSLTVDEVATAIAERFGATPARVGGTNAAPLWEVRRVAPAQPGKQASLRREEIIAEQEEAGALPKPVTTMVMGRKDEIVDRIRMDETTRGASAEVAQDLFREAGFKFIVEPGGLVRVLPRGTDMDVAGQKLLAILRRELALQSRPEVLADRLGGFINSIRYNYRPEVNGFGDLSIGIRNQLYAMAQGEASNRGIALAALGGWSTDIDFIGMNADVVLTRVYADAFGGDQIGSLLSRVLASFRDYFTEDEVNAALKEDEKFRTMLEKFIALTRRDAGGRLYRRTQALFKPKKAKTLAMLKSLALTEEEVDKIVEDLRKQGVEPPPKPKGKLTPIERLLLMIEPDTAEKVDDAIARAIAEAERNAGIKEAYRNAADAEELAALQEEFSDPEAMPSREDIEAGLETPEFNHWKVLRDTLTNYSPTTVKLIQDLIKSGFKKTKFNLEAKPEDFRIDIMALVQNPEAEVDRVINNYVDSVQREMEGTDATEETMMRVRQDILDEVEKQLEIARQRVREPMFKESLPPHLRQTAEESMKKMVNAKLFSDDRLAIPEFVQRVAEKGRVKNLLPSVAKLAQEVFKTPFYRQDELGPRFAEMLISRLGISAEEADNAAAVFEKAFATRFKKAKERAAKMAEDSVTPQEKVLFGPKKPLWEKIERLINAGVFDTTAVLWDLARDHGWKPPTPEMLLKMKELSAKEQSLRELSPAELATVTTPEDTAKLLTDKMSQFKERRSSLKKEMEVLWARMVRPIDMIRFFGNHRRNNAAAVNELTSANLLFTTGFVTRQLTTILFAQGPIHATTRSIGHAIGRWNADRNAKRDANLWRDIVDSLGDTFTARTNSYRAALRAAQASFLGRGETRNIDRLTSGIAALDRLKLKSDELYAQKNYVLAFLTQFLALVRYSYRFASALDNLHGLPAEHQEMRALVVTELRKNGKTRLEADQAADLVMGNMKDEIRSAVERVKYINSISGETMTKAETQEAAHNMVKDRAYGRMVELHLPADRFQEEIRLMRSTIGWNERETAGLGGLIGEGIRRSSNFVGEFGLPLPMARFSNAVAISINRGLMFTPAYKLAEIGGKTKSAWFATEADRHQRHVEAVVGTIFGALAWYLVYTGVITVRLRWPKDPEERELWERLGTRPGTVEFLMDDKRYSVSMTVGPLAYLAPYLAGASAAYDLMAQKQKRQDKLEAEARKKGLTAPPMPGWSMGEIAGVVGNAVWGQLIGGSRTATGLVGTLTDYGTWNLTKFGASQVAPLIPGIPAMQDMSRLAGVKLDSKAAGFWDYVLTTPWSKARRINMLGDPMGNPSDVERIVSSLTGGTVPWGVDVESKKNEDAYSALFSTGYRPPSIAPGKAFAFADGYRPMTEEEVSQYAQARGENFKQELIGLGPDPDLKEVQAAYARANQRALQSVGVTGTSSQPSPSRTSRAQVSTPRTSADVGISAPSLGRAGGRRFGSSLRMGMGRGPSLRRARRGRGFRPRSSRRLPSTRIGRSLRLRRPSLRRR